MQNSDTPNTVVFVDVETGGLDPSCHALLSIGLVHWERGVIDRKLEILVLPGDREISDSALMVNKINIDEHNKRAIPLNQALEEFRNFIDSMPIKPIMGGHNTLFDAQFLTFQGINLRDHFLYGYIDTKAVARFLIHAQIIQSNSTGLLDLCNLFSIKIQAHNALEDALGSAHLYNAFINLLRSDNGN